MDSKNRPSQTLGDKEVTTMTTSTPTITSAPATRTGLAGFRISCPCGMVWTHTVLSTAQFEAHAHAEWHARKAARRAR